MSVPSSPRHAEWQSSPMPKLTYRKPIPEDEIEQFDTQRRLSVITASPVNRNEPSRSSTITPPTVSVLPSKKKNSFLGSLFVKEPTLTALAMVEADLKAKHGAATPQSVPHVSARRMPEHVPKVNSKWDGVPEAIKLREREQKQRKHQSHRVSLIAPQSSRSRSPDGTDHVDSTDPQNLSRIGSGRKDRTNNWRDAPVDMQHKPSSVYSTSSGESQDTQPCHAPSVRSQSFRSPSGTSLPEITNFFPHKEGPPLPPIPQRWQNANNTSAYSTGSSGQFRSDATSNRDYHDGSSIDMVPEHSSTPTTTPREMSPVTPSHLTEGYGSPTKMVAGYDSTSMAQGQRPIDTRLAPIDAFLAGEAKEVTLNDGRARNAIIDTDLPLRKYQQKGVDRVEPDVARRPDSSRARLGLRASMVIRTEAAPWEAEELYSQSPNLAGPSPKARLPRALALFR